MEFIFTFFCFHSKSKYLFSFILLYFLLFIFCIFLFYLVSFPNASSDQQSTALPPLLVRLFSIPAVIPLFRDPLWGGLSLVPLITVIFLFLLFTWIFVWWCEKNTGRHFKGFYFVKSIQHAKQ